MKLNWKICLKVGVSAFLLFLAIYYWESAARFVGVLFGAAAPIAIGGAIAYCINILMSFYERHYFPKKAGAKGVEKTRRPVCLIGAVLTMLAIVAVVVSVVVPQFVDCIGTLINQAPEAMEKLLANPSIAKLVNEDLAAFLQQIDWEATIERILKVLESGLGSLFGDITGVVSSVLSGLVTAALAIIFAIYILLGRDKIISRCRDILETYAKPIWQKRILYTVSLINESFHKYIVGQCLEALILGVLCVLGMTVFGFPYATMIGALIALTALIPVAGAYIGAGVGAFMILSVSPQQALLFLIFIVVLQQLEGNLIYPRVVGSSVGLPGILVLAAVTMGGALSGIMGMFVSVPLTAAAYRALREDMSRRAEKRKNTVQKGSEV